MDTQVMAVAGRDGALAQSHAQTIDTQRTKRATAAANAEHAAHRGGRRWHTQEQQQDEQQEVGAGSVTRLVVLISTMPAASSIYSS